MSRIFAIARRTLTGLLTIAMILSSTPVNALADEVVMDVAEEQTGAYMADDAAMQIEAEPEYEAETLPENEDELQIEDCTDDEDGEQTEDESADEGGELLGTCKVTFDWDQENVAVKVVDGEFLEEDGVIFISAESGSTVTFTVTPSYGYKIDSVKADGEEIYPGLDGYSLNITKDTDVVINSSRIPPTVTFVWNDEQVELSDIVSIDEKGAIKSCIISNDGKVKVEYGDDLYFSASEKDNCIISSIKVNGVVTSFPEGYKICDITEDVVVEIGSRKLDGNNYVTFICDEGVDIAEAVPAVVDNVIEVKEEGTAKFKIKAKPGYMIKKVNINGDDMEGIPDPRQFFILEHIINDYTITVSCVKLYVDLTFRYSDKSKPKVFKYDAENGKGDGYELDENNMRPVHKDHAFSFCLEAPDADSEISEVKVGSKKIAAVKDETHNCEFYTIAASDLSKATTVTVTVKSSKITSVSLKGFKGTKDAPYVEQTLGTVAEYPITINKDGDIDRLSFSLTGTNAGAEIVKKEKETVLVVSNYSYDQTNETYDIEKGDIKVQFKDVDTAVGPEFTIKAPEKFKIAKPAVKIVKVSDVKVRVSVTVPKSHPALTYCRIVATRKTDDPSGTMKPDVVKNCKLSDQFEEDLVLSDNAPGMGKAAKYDISACLVQVDAYTGDPDADVAEGKATRSGDEAKVTAATVDPSYETKLSLGKKTTTFIAGQKNILLATAKFGSKTSFTSLGSAELIDSTGIQVLNSASGGIVFNGDEIILPDSAALEPGKYTLNVYPLLPEGTYATPATVAITVQMPIFDIAVEAPATKVYKGNNKAATVKTTVTLNHGSKELAPASKKLDWKVVYADDENKPAPSTVTVKNGTVSIAKDYEFGEDKKFKVVATAADYEGNDTSGSAMFTVISNPLAIKSITISDIENLSKEQLSSSLIGKDIVVKDAGGNELSPADYTLKVSDTKNFVVEGSKIKSIEKPGTYTLTATAEDGGKSSVKQTVTVKSTEATEYSVNWYSYKGSEALDDVTKYAKIDDPDALKGAGYVIVESKAATKDNTVFANAASFKLKNAAKVKEWLSDDGHSRYLLMRFSSGKKITVTHSYKIGRNQIAEDYEFEPGFTDKMLKPVKGEKLEFWAGSRDISYEFRFDFGDYEPSNKCVLEFFPGEESVKNSENKRLAKCLSDQEKFVKTETVDGKTVYVLSAPAGGDGNHELRGFSKGTYKVYAALVDTSKGGVVSSMTALTFKAIEAKKPSGKIDSSKNKRIVIEDEEGQYAKLPVALKDCIGYKPESGIALSNNQGGTVNKFSKYFDVIVGKVEDGKVAATSTFDEEAALYLVRTGESGLTTEDNIGWAEYTLIGNDGRTAVTIRDCIYIDPVISAPIEPDP